MKHQPEALDRARVRELEELDPEHGAALVAELFRAFLTQATADLDRLAGAIHDEQAEMVEDVGHRLRGSAGSLGAVHLAEVCARLEAVGRSAELAEAAPLLEELRSELERVQLAARAFVH